MSTIDFDILYSNIVVIIWRAVISQTALYVCVRISVAIVNLEAEAAGANCRPRRWRAILAVERIIISVKVEYCVTARQAGESCLSHHAARIPARVGTMVAHRSGPDLDQLLTIVSISEGVPAVLSCRAM